MKCKFDRSMLAGLVMLAAFSAWAEDDIPVDQPATENDAADVVENPASEAQQGPMLKPRAQRFVRPSRAMMKAGVWNLKSGISFLDENGRKPGVITTKSGLQYKILRAGTGPRPSEDSAVRCNYIGSLIDGTVFEQSDPSKKTAVRVNKLIPGLREAFKLMPAGSHWEVYIPPELAFGAAGKMPSVSPSSVVIYDLDLIGIEQLTTSPKP